MLAYETKVREEFKRCRGFAAEVLRRIQAGTDSESLLRDAEVLAQMCDQLNDLLPVSVRGTTNLERHLHFLRYYLIRNEPSQCESDARDIISHDLDQLERRFNETWQDERSFDQELFEKTESLVTRREFDSAIRKAFVILKSRIVSRFGLAADLDGVELVNRLLGTNSSYLPLSETDKRAYRDLLAGVFMVFRNRHAHHDSQPPAYEVEAVLATINFLLKWIDGFDLQAGP